MKLDPNTREQEVLKLWRDQGTFQQVQDRRRSSTPFVMYEGPPTANGAPGIHHVLTRTFKDAIARYRTMTGRYVERKAGWDEHGLPVEIGVQKALGLHTREDVEKYGVDKFNEACQESTRKFIGEWERLTERMGYWLDFENAYRTSDPDYIKQVWLALEAMYVNKEIYEDYKVVPWACDSQTVLSNAELEQGYKEVEHLTCTVKFRLNDDTNTYLLAWTTTPWTLPANMALAVNPDLTYYESVVKDVGTCEYRVLSIHKYRCENGPEAIPISGKKLVGLKYHHPFTHEVCTVYGADFVKADVGTGVVHIAPAYGADDYALWQKHMAKEEIVRHVNDDGSFNEKAPFWLREVNLLHSNFAKANKMVDDYLRSSGKSFGSHTIKHQYPHNWRTGKPLIYTLRKSWYIRTSKMPLKEANSHVEWYPEHIKEGRFGQWLEGGRDWAISRERFWGTPLPFYNNGTQSDFMYPSAPHKPLADRPYRVKEDNSLWERTPEVLDCWFDSGAMPFAGFEKYQQADVICEGIDQTRGWFYTLMVIGVALTEQSPYKAAIALGHVLDKDGQKMSKSKGNGVDPWGVFEREGADAVRWYMLKNPVGNPLLWNEGDVRKVNQVFFNRLLNCVQFYEQQEKVHVASNVLYDATDSWLVARTWQTVRAANRCLGEYNFSKACELIEVFVDDLSNVWLRANRSRFQGQEAKVVVSLLKATINIVARMLAPFCPMLAEHVWQRMNEVGPKSVHLCDWPIPPAYTQKTTIIEDMMVARSVVAEGLKLRDTAKVRLRQPLPAVLVPKPLKVAEPLLSFVKSELNVKSVVVGDYEHVGLDLVVDDKLAAEGMVRDLLRIIQKWRKDLGLVRGDKIRLALDVDDHTKELLQSHLDNLLATVFCVQLEYGPVPDKVTVGGVQVGLEVGKIP